MDYHHIVNVHGVGMKVWSIVKGICFDERIALTGIEVRVIVDVDKLLAGAPNNFVIVDALAKCVEVVEEHKKVMCSISGGATVM